MTQNPRPKLEIVRNADDAPDLPLPDDTSQEMEPLDQEEPGAELEPAVIDGEIVSDKPDRGRRLPSVVVDKVTVLRPSPATQKRVRTVRGHGALVLAGWHSWIVRAKDGLTGGDIREQIRIARATGDREALELWIDKRREAKNDRYDRLMKLPLLVLKMAILAGCCLLAVPVLLVVVSTIVWMTGAGGWTDTWVWFGSVLRWLINAAKVAWSVFVVALFPLLVWAGHREGRRTSNQAAAGLVAADAGPGARDVFPDEGAIVKALQHLGIPELNKAFKAGWRPRIVMPTCRDGKGWRTQLEPPYGVTVEMIVQKKKVLAHNLARFPVEVWPTEPKAGVLDLWVADQGSLTGPLPPWPLLKDGTADYFRGVPVAVNIRGKTIMGLLFEANYAIAGRMGSGKSTLIITLLLGALLDPLVIADVFVMAVNSDYDPMKPRLRTLMTGTGEEVVEKCMNTLREAYSELDVRGKALQEHGVRANSRELAEKDARLRPRIIVIDECQALFMHEEYGAEAVAIATKLEFAARKYGITLIYATPEPTADSLPRKLVSTSSNQASFAIGDQIGNDAVLGTGSYKAGISAVGLKPKTDDDLGDVGTCVARGFESNPGLLRCYYVGVGDAKAVVERALQIQKKAGIGPSATLTARARDLLDDLDQVLGAERIKVADVPGLLRKLAPSWPPYQGLNGVQLKDILTREYSVRVPNVHNVFHLDPAEVRRARALREAGE